MEVKKKDWETFEQLAAKIYKRLEPGAVVTHDDRIYGNITERDRQIDVSIRSKVAGHDILVIVQAKDRGRAPDVNVIGEFSEVMRDVGASKGVIVCRKAPAKSNIIYARKRGIDICTVFDIDDRMWNRDLMIPVVVVMYFGEIDTSWIADLRKGDSFLADAGQNLVSAADDATWVTLNELVRRSFLASGIKDGVSAITMSGLKMKTPAGDVREVIEIRSRGVFESKRRFKYCEVEAYQALKNYSEDEIGMTELSFKLPPITLKEGWRDLSEDEFPPSVAELPLVELSFIDPNYENEFAAYRNLATGPLTQT